jgi:hypothetical protein
MTNETTTPANLHKVDIGNNPALAWLYILGGSGLVAGNIIVGVNTAVATSSGVAADTAFWGIIGNSLGTGGLLFLVGALVSHAVNWQIGRSLNRP